MKNKLTKIQVISQQLKEYLKTDNEWVPYFNERTLPPFIRGKSKHNNKTGVNIFNSNVIEYKSFGRKKRPPLGYICDFKSEKDGNNVQLILQNYGINAPLQTFPSINIRLEFADSNKFISKFSINDTEKIIQ